MKINFLSVKAQASNLWKILQRHTRHQITATKHSDTSSLEVSETDGLTSSLYFTPTPKKLRKSLEKKKKKKAFPFAHPMLENFENTQPILIIWFYCTGKLIIIAPLEVLTHIRSFRNAQLLFMQSLCKGIKSFRKKKNPIELLGCDIRVGAVLSTSKLNLCTCILLEVYPQSTEEGSYLLSL